ncbi:DUF1002 domain-containing protein [Clostridium thailandense]|uniref:DUF1002 domain-containing protein n=1 Tax=Clostridium thailandense TaxID=2794346 RepID=A0A949TKJ9_9CLOT|nr:DUF1002 domain-containing protein [Clostridium thailandense]MBV7274569.1 DUF1002 domain-containing protein [Clostridium thailandense]
MKFKTIVSKLLVAAFAISTVIAVPLQRVHADAYKVVTLGADLTDAQKQDMLKYFGVNKNEANVLDVNRDEEIKYLANIASEKEIGTKSISCSYVEPTNSGGLNISTHNIYWVSDSMIKNALITAGIKNANVKAAAPFNVSGTAALTGILKGFENSSAGTKIDENKKKTANEELMVTGNLGEKIGQDKAAGLINEVKTEVVKDKPKSDEEVKKIVNDVVSGYKYKLSQDDIDKITNLMKNINSLNLNFNDLKDQLNSVKSHLQSVLQSDEAKGFFAKLWAAISSFFSNILSK